MGTLSGLAIDKVVLPRYEGFSLLFFPVAWQNTLLLVVLALYISSPETLGLILRSFFSIAGE